MSKIEFKKGFFECIAAADSEKVHSQTITEHPLNGINSFNHNLKPQTFLEKGALT